MVSFCEGLQIETVKDVGLVAAIVDDAEFRAVEKAAGIHAVGGDEIARGLAAVSEVEAAVGRSEDP